MSIKKANFLLVLVTVAWGGFVFIYKNSCEGARAIYINCLPFFTSIFHNGNNLLEAY